MICLYRFEKNHNEPYLKLQRNKKENEFLCGYGTIYNALMVALKNEVINEENPELKLTLYYQHYKDTEVSKVSSYIYAGDNVHYGEYEVKKDSTIFAKSGYGEYVIKYKKPVPGAEGVFAFYTCTMGDRPKAEETELDPNKMVCGMTDAFSFIKHI